MNILSKNNYYKLQVIAAKTALTIFSIFSINAVRKIAVIIAHIAWFFPTKHKKYTLKNIELCFSELTLKEQKKLAKKSLIETAKTSLEMPAMYMWKRANILKLVKRVKNIELFEKAIAENNGVILLAPHLGNWEMMRHFAASRSNFTVLYQPLKFAELDELVMRLRSKDDTDVQPITQRGIAKLFRELQSGAVTAILPDSSPKSGGVFAPFFGVETYTATLSQKITQKTRSRAICCAAIRVKNGFAIEFCEVGGDIYGDDQRAAAAALNKAIEDLVRANPSQYFWEYRRFKVRPEGEARFY